MKIFSTNFLISLFAGSFSFCWLWFIIRVRFSLGDVRFFFARYLPAVCKVVKQFSFEGLPETGWQVVSNLQAVAWHPVSFGLACKFGKIMPTPVLQSTVYVQTNKKRENRIIANINNFIFSIGNCNNKNMLLLAWHSIYIALMVADMCFYLFKVFFLKNCLFHKNVMQ